MPRVGIRSLFAVGAAVLALCAPAGAAVRDAGSVLPPGQSGFVSAAGLATGTGSPHLTDQVDLFRSFRFKNAMLGQPGAAGPASPTPGVTITRDAFGVPTITAGDDVKVWLGAGYAVAEDRLFQLELFRRATQGRLAEVLGKGYLEDDVVARRDFYTAEEAMAQFDKLQPQFKARVEAYRDGVNL